MRTVGLGLLLVACVVPKDDDPMSSSGTSSDTGVATGFDTSVPDPSDTDGASGPLPPPPGGTETTTEATDDGDSTGESSGGETPPIVHAVASLPYGAMEGSGLTGLSEFESEWDERACANPECASNVPPQIDSGILWVNGAPAPRGATIHVGDRIGVLFPYEDPDCNVACGSRYHGMVDPFSMIDGGGSLPTNLPCGTGSSDVYFAGDFHEADDPGTYSARLIVHDACGGVSNTALIEFEVVP